MSKYYTQTGRIAQLKQAARHFNRDGFEPQLRNVLGVLGEWWDDDAAFVAFKHELARTKITRACRDLGPNFRGGWQ